MYTTFTLLSLQIDHRSAPDMLTISPLLLIFALEMCLSHTHKRLRVMKNLDQSSWLRNYSRHKWWMKMFLHLIISGVDMKVNEGELLVKFLVFLLEHQYSKYISSIKSIKSIILWFIASTSVPSSTCEWSTLLLWIVKININQKLTPFWGQ